MTLNLELPKELEKVLRRDAKSAGLSVTDYALELLGAARSNHKDMQTGADLVAYWKKMKVIGSRKDIKDSQAFARKLREQAQRRNHD